MTDSDSIPETRSGCARSGRIGGVAPWLIFAVCCVSFAAYLVLHTRELRLIGEWLISR